MLITGPLRNTLDALQEHHNQLKNMEAKVIASLFEQFPTLNSFELESYTASDEGFCPLGLKLIQVNGSEWVDGYNELDSIYFEKDNDDHKSWLVEANLKAEEFRAFLLALRRLDPRNWQDDLKFKRESV